MPTLGASAQLANGGKLVPSTATATSCPESNMKHQNQLTTMGPSIALDMRRSSGQHDTTKMAGSRGLARRLGRALRRLNPKRCCKFAFEAKTSLSHHATASKHHPQSPTSGGSQLAPSVSFLELFRYASLRERLGVALGFLCMLYAASWQPISVFILATMAPLMGKYSRQAAWLSQVSASNLSVEAFGGMVVAPPPPGSPLLVASSTDVATGSNLTAGSWAATAREHLGVPTGVAHEGDPSRTLSVLAPLFSLFEPMFDSESSANELSIKSAANGLLELESRLFLRKSLEINGSAFLLAQTQLAAFMVGMLVIVWSAKRQAARIKLLYFSSCLRQEQSWFDSLDSPAAGSGSSMNVLVAKFEDGIGVKLALLVYFVGHICLFAATAFVQLPELAWFCMPFVLLVWLIIVWVGHQQSRAIASQTQLSKRSLQLAEEILSAIRTVFAFNGQSKELARFSLSLEPSYRKSLAKHLYTAFSTALSKFSIFACFSAFCFYAQRLFPPYANHGPENRAVVLAVMRGAEVSIVNILISIPFMEALQQSKGCIARIYETIERKSAIDPRENYSASTSGSSNPYSKPLTLSSSSEPSVHQHQQPSSCPDMISAPSIGFNQVKFAYAQRPSNQEAPDTTTVQSEGRRDSLPFLKLGPSGGATGRAADLAMRQLELGAKPTLLAPNMTSAPNGPPKIAQRRASEMGPSRRRQSNLCSLSESPELPDSLVNLSDQESTNASIDHQQPKQLVVKPPLFVAAQRTRRASDASLGRIKMGTSELVLKRLTINVEPGQTVALVGPSGSGKSTVLALVQRLYDVSSGRLTVNGHDIRSMPVAWLRSQIGIVGQEPRLFDISISDNIRLGLSNSQRAQLDDRQQHERVEEAARAAGAHEFIEKLPRGYDTRVGGAGGVQLSGGQKQRIAIARALVRRPKILLLDESTSALDSESEAQVQAAIRAASVGRTTLIVAHRLLTVRHADLILVMQSGQLVESGTHEQLLKTNGLYKRMHDEQLNAKQTSATSGRKQAIHESGDARSIASCSSGSSGGSHFEYDDDDSDDGASTSDLEDTTEDSSWASSTSGLDHPEAADHQQDPKRLGKPPRPRPIDVWRLVGLPKWGSLAAAFASLLAGLILPMNLIAHSFLFSAFAYEQAEQLGGYLHLFGLVILSFSAFVFIISFLQIILPGYVGEKVSMRLRCKMLESLLQKPVFYFDVQSNGPGALCDRMNSHTSNLQSIAGTRVATLLEASSTLVVGAFFGFGQNLRLSLFCLSFALLVLFTTMLESRLMQIESRRERHFDGQLANLMADALSNIKTIASLNGEQFFMDRFADIIEQRHASSKLWMVLFRTLLTSLKFVMPAMSWSASMYYGCQLLVDGQIELQTVFIVCPVVLFAVNDTFRALVFLPELFKAHKSARRLYRMHQEFSPQLLQTQTLGQQLLQQRSLAAGPHAAAGATTTTSVDETLAARPSVVSQSQHLPSYMSRRRVSRLDSLVPSSATFGRIEFKQVQFAYPIRPNQIVLDDFTLSLAPGECVALVGGSGSGKSTCVSILEKFYHFQAGNISIDGHDLRLVDSQWMRSQIGLVSQEPTLLSYSIADNIRYGDNSRLVNMDEVVEAARIANIHDFIMSLPQQYDTQLTGGVSSQLSGGQRQRIAIARALVRRAPILIFDEATSALDTQSESLVQDALMKTRRGRTSLIIAHRLATIRDADKIVVMRDGRVIESGRHKELLKLPNGHYRSLWEAQQTSAGAHVHASSDGSDSGSARSAD